MAEPAIATPKVLVASFNTWHMDHTARAYERRGALAGVYAANGNIRGVPPELYHRCWPFHVVMKPFYHGWPARTEWVQYHLFMGLFDGWLRRQKLPAFDAVQAIAWGAKAPFDIAERAGALKVLDAPNSYPTTYDAYERRELALWAPQCRPAVPAHIISQAVRDIERADVVLCPSQWVYDSMLANGVPAAKCVLNPFGVNVDLFRPRENLPERPRFITVGNIRIRKGHQYLFRAMQAVQARCAEAELVCVGQYHADFKRERDRWSGRFTHYPHLSHEKLAEEYRRSTAFVLPSTEEGLARVVTEAMASGLPIVATYESGATTVVEHEQEGLIVPSRDAESLTRAMLRLIQEPELCRKLGEQAAQRGHQKNTWQDYGDRCLAAVRARQAAR